ncbi:MAG: hypothetical protein V4563_14210 [Pseudomonadota bacterium]
MLEQLKVVGSVMRYRFCASNGCITLPRQIETIEAAAVCNNPITIRNGWFEFVEHGYGQRVEERGWTRDMMDRGIVCSFQDIRGTGKQLKVYNDLTVDGATQILFQGYNDDGNWIKTADGEGGYYDGELITPSASGTLSVSNFSALTGVQKPITQGVIRVYEYDTDLTTQRAIAIYEPDETRPTYRRILIPGLSTLGSCTGTADTCATKAVTVMVKIAFMPVYVDTDWLQINSLPALKSMCQALIKEEKNMIDDAHKYEANAVRILQNQLQNHEGDAPVIAIKMPSNDVYGGGVPNVL